MEKCFFMLSEKALYKIIEICKYLWMITKMAPIFFSLPASIPVVASMSPITNDHKLDNSKQYTLILSEF